MAAVCWQCIEDEYVRNIIREKGERLECSVCKSASRKAFTTDDLGELLGPVIREYFQQGEQVRKFGDDDHDWWEQEGDPLSFWVQEVLGQHFEFEDEIVDAVVESEHVRPQDGEEAFFDKTCLYVETPIETYRYQEEWRDVVQELKHKRRFFSSSAEAFFEDLFAGVEEMKVWNREKRQDESVVCELPERSNLFRARICGSHLPWREAYKDPLGKIGPPPPSLARSGKTRQWK